MTHLSRLLLPACLALVACGGSASPPHGDDDDAAGDDDDTAESPDAAPTSDPVAYADLMPALAAAYCSRVFACCDMDERKLIGIIPYIDMRPDIPDEAACTAYMTTHLESQSFLAAVENDIASGVLAYDAAKAGACLDEMAAMSCDAFGHDFQGMRNMRSCPPFTQNRAAGEACQHDVQCPSGYCAQVNDTGDPVCRDKPKNGELCPSGTCADGLFCDSFGDATCKPLLADGAECIFNEDCTSTYCSYDNSTGDTGFCSIAETWVCDGE